MIHRLISLLPLLVVGLLSCTASAQQLLEQRFHENGRLAVTRIQVGSEERFITYHENGRIRETGSYLGGVPTGRWTRYNERGEEVLRAYFNNGRRIGTWVMQSLDGTFSYRLRFSNGRMQRGEQYDAEGALIAARDY